MPRTNPKAKQKKTDNWYAMAAKSNSVADIDIYGEIGYWGITAKEFRRDLKDLGNVGTLNVHINSPGGSVVDGLAIYNSLKNHSATVNVTVDGLAASMGSVIAMAGDNVTIPENALFMIHNPWGFASGDADEMRRSADVLDKMKATMLSAYVDKTGLSEDEVSALLDDETWYTGAEAVEAGFADQTSDAIEVDAYWNPEVVGKFKNAPAALVQFANAAATNLLNEIEQSASADPETDPEESMPKAIKPAPKPTQSTEQEVRAKLLEENKARVSEINGVFEHFEGHDELKAACIADMECTATQAKDKLLEALGKNTTPSVPAGTNTHIHTGNGNIVGDSVRASVMSRAGHEESQSDNAYNHMTLRELARASLVDRGVGVATLNPMQMVGAAFTHGTSDFGNILLDVAHKSLLMGWDDAEETFDKWTLKGQLSDFKTAHRVGLGAFPSLRKVRPGAEYKYVTVGDRGEPIALATYGELFAINRQAIINDDLQALTEIPMKMGMAAKATIGDLVYALITENVKMSDGVAIFDNKHGNLGSGAISVESLDIMRQKMRRQKEGERHLNIRPAFCLVPTALEAKANQTIRSASVAGADINSGIDNPIRNFAEVIAEPRLDDHSAEAWYLTAAQGRDTVEIAYLNGIDTPYIDQQQGFNTDGVATKVRIDAGVAARDYRGLAKSSGK